MATSAVHAADEQIEQSNHEDVQAAAFQTLEQKVLRAIELLRHEREMRASAEERARRAEEHGLEMEIRVEEQEKQLNERAAEIERQNGRATEQQLEIERQHASLAEHAEQIRRHEGDLSQLQNERDHVRQRVEKLLQHLDEFTGA